MKTNQIYYRKTLTQNQFLIMVLLFITMFFMISDYKVLCNKVGAVCSVLILFLLLLSDRKLPVLKNTPQTKVCVAIFAFLVYYTITSLTQFHVSAYIEDIAYYIIEFVPIFLALYFYKKPNLYIIRWVLILFLLVWNVFCVISFVYCMQVTDLARLMAANRAAYYTYAIGGGYPMAYGSAILLVFFFQCLVDKSFQSRKIKCFLVFEIILMFLVLYATNSFIILIAAVIGVICCMINRLVSNRLKPVMIVGTIMIAVIGWLNIEDILRFLVNSTQNEFWLSRWSEIYDYIVAGEESFHIGLRLEVYETSWETIKENFWIGTGYQFGNNPSAVQQYGIGDHSTVLDTLAQFGIIGAIPFFYICVYATLFNRANAYNSMYMVTFYIMLFLNPIFSCYHIMLVVFLIIPLIQYVIKNQVLES